MEILRLLILFILFIAHLPFIKFLLTILLTKWDYYVSKSDPVSYKSWLLKQFNLLKVFNYLNLYKAFYYNKKRDDTTIIKGNAFTNKINEE